jgi:RimJ/RimL family protein N-acetyltransferase
MIRHVTKLDDVHALEALAHHERNEEGPWSDAALKTCEWWVAYDGRGRAVGYCGAKLSDLGETYIAWYWVRPESRGKGLQRRMVRACLVWCRRRRQSAAVTYTHHQNSSSARVLIACGFRPYEPDWAWVGREYVYWQRAL